MQCIYSLKNTHDVYKSGNNNLFNYKFGNYKVYSILLSLHRTLTVMDFRRSD